MHKKYIHIHLKHLNWSYSSSNSILSWDCSDGLRVVTIIRIVALVSSFLSMRKLVIIMTEIVVWVAVIELIIVMVIELVKIIINTFIIFITVSVGGGRIFIGTIFFPTRWRLVLLATNPTICVIGNNVFCLKM